MPNYSARDTLLRMAHGGPVHTPSGEPVYGKGATAADLLAAEQRILGEIAASPDTWDVATAYNAILESGVTVEDALAAGVKQDTIDAIFTSGAPLPETAFSTPASIESSFTAYEPYAGQTTEQIRSGAQQYLAKLMDDGVIDPTERREIQTIATERGVTFQDMLAAGVDPNIMFNVPAAKEPDPPVIVDPFPQTQTKYVAPTVYDPAGFGTDPGIYAPGEEALDREFRDSPPRTEVLDQYGNLAGFDYTPAAKLLSATGSGFSFTPPSVTGRPRSLMDTGTLNRYTRGRSAQDLRQLVGGDQARYDQYSGLLNNRGSYGGGLSRSQLYALTRQQDSQRRATGVSASTGTISDYLRLNPDVGVDYARAQAAGELPAGTTAEGFALNHYNTLGRSEIAEGTRAPFTLAQGTNRTSPIAGGNNYFSAGMGGFEGEGDSNFTTRGYDNELLARNLGPAGGAIIRPVFVAEGGLVKKPREFADGGPADLKALDPTDPLFITETVQEVNPDMVKRDIPPMQWDGVERPTGQEASESRNMLENILSGAGKIPESVANYFVRPDETGAPSLVSLRQVGSDVAALGGAVKEGLKEDPVGFALDVLPVTGEIRSGMDADKFSDLANEARAAGDTKAADLYEQIVTLSASGAVPLMGMGARAGRRAAINAAEEAIKKGSVTEASKMLDEVDAVNAPRADLDFSATVVSKMQEIALRPSVASDPVAMRFLNQIMDDPDAAIAQYAKIGETNGGKIINTDLVRELSPDYLADRTLAFNVHQPASALSEIMFNKRVAETMGEEGTWIFTGGGPASGKTAGLSKAAEEAADLVLDGTLAKSC